MEPKFGDIWKHTKRGSTYEIIGIGRMRCADSAKDMQRCVVYISTANTTELWIRPVEEFLEIVDSVPRFSKIK